MYKYILKPIFFRFQPERIHYIVFDLLKFTLAFPGMKWVFRKWYCIENPKLEREVFGLKFKNPVGLAAGFDKDAKLFNQLDYVGFGFIEIGTLTPVGQPGNPQPRLFRIPQDEGLINRMGFNNGGVEEAVERLKNRKTKVLIGGNIGKNKVTPNDKAVGDYEFAFNTLYAYVDYFVVNVSSPNTPNLRELQDKEPLTLLLTTLMKLRNSKSDKKPILLKIAPDLSNTQLDDIVDILLETKIDGLIATNTTISRDQLKTSEGELNQIGNGGVSGKPVKQRSTEVIRYIYQKSQGKFPIIGVGGIHSPEDAMEKLEAGASLIQIYTGFIYEGPGLVKRINKKILENS
ncbi:MAG: quinone-dependent dihydroorotate dehydrogenase [Crocinitomicaceae bacterium]